MEYKYTHFRPENIAPSGATGIGVFNSKGEKVYTIPLGRLTPPKSGKLYSFGVLSDTHVYHLTVDFDPVTKFEKALAHFEQNGCQFCVVCGDLTQTGFYLRTVESDASTAYLDESQFAKHSEICGKYNIPVYELCGNHESYYGMPITNNLSKLGTHTGKSELFYTVEQGNDLFILLGQPQANLPMGDDALQWLQNTLEANISRRCFIFIHPQISNGMPNGFTDDNPIFGWWGTKTTEFVSLLQQHKNTILFHGHTHSKFECQEYDADVIYTSKDGFKSVHVPSTCKARGIKDGAWISKDYGSQGYIVDVYADYIILNGIDFKEKEEEPVPVALGTFKIQT